MMIDTDKWVTIDTYAFLKGIKRRWVYDLIKKGKVQTIKLWGKQLIYIGDGNKQN
jgi:hypothetical protein